MVEVNKKQVFFWFGDNDFDKQESLRAWQGAFEKKYSNLNIVSLDFRDGRSAADINRDLKNSLQMDSLFGSSKLIVLRDFFGKRNEKNVEATEIIKEFLEKIAPTFFIIFFQSLEFDATSAVYKRLKVLEKEQVAELKEYISPFGINLKKWVENRFRLLQTTVDQTALDHLIALVGADLWHLETEVQKLANYARGRMVTMEDVRLLVKGKYNEDIFALMDALGRRDKKTALALMNDQLNSGANEMYLLTMLVRQFRLLRQVKIYKTEFAGATKDMVARELKMHPFVAQKTLAQISMFPQAELDNIYQQLLNMEWGMKSRGVDFMLQFERLVINL